MKVLNFNSFIVLTFFILGFSAANAARNPSIQFDGTAVIRRIHRPAGGSYWSYGKIQKLRNEIDFEMSSIAWDGANSCQWHVSSSVVRVLPIDRVTSEGLLIVESASGRYDVIALQGSDFYQRAITQGGVPGSSLKTGDRVKINGVLFGTNAETYKVQAFNESGSVICVQPEASSQDPAICLKAGRLTAVENAN